MTIIILNLSITDYLDRYIQRRTIHSFQSYSQSSKGASPVSQQVLRLKLESYKIKGLRQFRAAARQCSGFVRFDLAFPFLPLDFHVAQSAHGMATTASAEAGLGNKAHAHAVDEGSGHFLFRGDAVLVGRRREVERADAVELHRATLRHVVAHHTTQGREHGTHVGRAYGRFGYHTLGYLLGSDGRTHENGLGILLAIHSHLHFLIECYSFDCFVPSGGGDVNND